MVLPSAPSDAEKYYYTDSKKAWLYSFAIFSVLALSAGMWLFIIASPFFVLFAPFVVITMFYLSVSYFPILVAKPFDLKAHSDVLQKGFPEKVPSVDILLPCCGEPLSVLENTYRHVRQLRWPGGNLKVWVLDDGWKDSVQELAERYGFEYIRRPNRPHLKKAGNLRHAFGLTKGDFFVIYDADFCPRPEFLLETMPYMIQDENIAIVQTPQVFEIF